MINRLACWIGVALASIACTPSAQGEPYALLIGIADYSDANLDSLDGPRNDVALMREVLLRRFELPDSHITTLLDEEASHLGIRAAFSDLARSLEPEDMVYIHYAGHGSRAPDRNGDERSGYDQTWVSHGARTRPQAERSSLDDYDVLDDEIEAWLGEVLAKTDHVIFVSDSCHSASVTRGEAPKIRAAPADFHEHPLGTRGLKPADTRRAIRIGAARDVQAAAEFESDEGVSYGLFTWNWAQALNEASRGTTWHEVFQRAAAQVQLRRGQSQQPQMEGSRRMQVFGGEFAPQQRTVIVSRVGESGKVVWLQAGELAGMTVGSVFQRKGSIASASPPTLEITRVRAMESEGKTIEGRFAVGDLVSEESHVYAFQAVPVFLAGDYIDDLDQPLRETLTTLLDSLPAYDLATTQKNAELVLYVTRPARDKGGDLLYESADDTLPIADRNSEPEVWVLSSVEQLIHDSLRIPFTNRERGRTLLLTNLERLARVREVRMLGNAGGGEVAVTLEATVMVPAERCNAGEVCHSLPGVGLYRVAGHFPISELNATPLQTDQILTYTLTNRSRQDYYLYLLGISADGSIDMLFPTPGANRDAALVQPGMKLDLFAEGYGHLLEVAGDETVKIIASRRPIDVSLLEQSGFVERGSNADMNPLERLLTNSMLGTRGAIQIRNDSWQTRQVTFSVSDRTPN